MRNIVLSVPALLLVAAFGCVPQPTVSEEVDRGVLCFDEQSNLIVDFQTCLSSSCDTVTEATCAVTLDTSSGRDTYTVTTTLRIESEGQTCTDDCGFTTTQCAEPLIDGVGDPQITFDGTTVDYFSLPQCSEMGS